MNRFQRFREKTLVFLTHRAALPLLRLLRKPATFDCTEEQLRSFPPDSTGGALRRFHEDNGLALLPQYEQHDVKHVLTGYPPTEKGEVCLQAFLLGNGARTPATVATVLFGLLTMPEYWRAIAQAIRKGKRAASLQAVDWAGVLGEPLERLRGRLRVEGFTQRSKGRKGSWYSKTGGLH